MRAILLAAALASAAAGAWWSTRNVGTVVAAGAGAGTQAQVQAQADTDADVVALALRAGRPTVVEFGANNCTACRQMKPILAQVAREQAARFQVLDIDLLNTPGAVGRYKIQLMPTQVFFDATGRETSRHMGKMSAEEIVARLEAGAP